MRLFVRGQSGDAAAYHAFLQELGAHLRAYLRPAAVRLPDEVEDLVQESLLAMHNQRHTYDPAQPLTAWVHAIARYKMIDLLRRRGGARSAARPAGRRPPSLPPLADKEAGDARRDVWRLLDTLPDRHRLPIVHVKLEGRPWPRRRA